MGYFVLWLSSVTVAVLTVGLGAAIGVRLKKRWQAIAAIVASALPGFLFGISIAILTGRLLARGVKHHWFGCALSWLLVFLVASVLLALGAFTRGADRPDARAKTWSLGRLGVGVGAGAAVFVATLFLMDIAARTELAQIHVDALARLQSAAPPRVSDHRNAALVYAQAFEAMGDALRWRKATWYRDIDKHTLDARTDEVDEVLRGQSATLALLRKASAMPDFHFETNHVRGLAMRVPHFRYWLGATRLLTLSAFNRAARGDTRGAVEDISAARRMADHLASGSALMQVSIAITLNRDACLAYEYLLNRGPFDYEALNGQTVRAVCDPFRPAYQRALEVEAASYTLFVADSSKLRLLCLHEDPQPTIEIRLAEAMPILWRVFFARDEIRTFDSWVDRHRALFYGSYHEMLDKEKDLSSGYWEARRSSLLMWIGLLQFPFSFGTYLAENRLCQGFADLALATQIYRGHKGRYPATLAELTPEYIDVIPVDPYSPGAERLKMALAGDGIVLYSVGPDGKDDGGVSNNWRPLLGTEGDHNFCLGNAYQERRVRPARAAEERYRSGRAKRK